MIELRPGDTGYPALLGAIPAAPMLFVRGELDADDALAIAIVGSRRASPYGIAATERLASDLAARGVTIVSGLARGIDTAAHRSALAAGGRTLAVLGSGVDVVYPPENATLARTIESRGAQRRLDHRGIRRRSRPRNLRRSWPNHVADERRHQSTHTGRC